MTNITSKQAVELILELFNIYKAEKIGKDIYNLSDDTARLILQFYHTHIDRASSREINKKFKERFIYNENVIENDDPNRSSGLEMMYDYITNIDFNNNSINIYIILRLHQLIYSKSEFPEFGGKFRNTNVFLPNSGIEIPDYSYVPTLIQSLYAEFDELLKNANKLEIIQYVNECIKFHCKLVKIHPFYDGNGRVCRGLLNLMLIKANLLPVYVSEKEKDAYGIALNKAITQNDFSLLYKFYHYKICDSIVELDIREKKLLYDVGVYNQEFFKVSNNISQNSNENGISKRDKIRSD